MIRSARKRIDFKSATFCFQLFSQTAFFSPRRNVRKRIPRSLRGRLFSRRLHQGASGTVCLWHPNTMSMGVRSTWPFFARLQSEKMCLGMASALASGLTSPPLGSQWYCMHSCMQDMPTADHICVCMCVCVCVCVRGSGSPWPIKVRPRVGPSLPRQLGAARIPFGGPPDHGQESSPSRRRAPVDVPNGNQTGGTS